MALQHRIDWKPFSRGQQKTVSRDDVAARDSLQPAIGREPLAELGLQRQQVFCGALRLVAQMKIEIAADQEQECQHRRRVEIGIKLMRHGLVKAQALEKEAGQRLWAHPCWWISPAGSSRQSGRKAGRHRALPARPPFPPTRKMSGAGPRSCRRHPTRSRPSARPQRSCRKRRQPGSATEKPFPFSFVTDQRRVIWLGLVAQIPHAPQHQIGIHRLAGPGDQELASGKIQAGIGNAGQTP